MKTAIQGTPGSFHHIVARRWYGDDQDIVCKDSFVDVFKALESGEATRAVVAVENSLYGSFTEVYDLLQKHDYKVVGEVGERIHQNLIGFPGTKVEDVRRVYSQYMALAQCDNFLNTSLPKAERVDYHDTAAAVAYVKELRDPSHAAVASALAAELHGMEIIQPKIEDYPYNYTRFLIIEPNGTVPEGANKASLIIETSHEAGALYRALGIFNRYSCNLTKLQSHPVPGSVWTYQFYIDVEIDLPTLELAQQALQQQNCRVRVLGHYKATALQYED